MLSGQNVPGVGYSPPTHRESRRRTPSMSRGGNMGAAGPTVSMFVSLRKGDGGAKRRRGQVRWLLATATSGGVEVTGPKTRDGCTAQAEEITSALRTAAAELEITEEFAVATDPGTAHLGTVTLSASRETCGALERALKARFLFVPVEGAELRVSTRVAMRPGRPGDCSSPREVRKLEHILSSRDAVPSSEKLRNGCADAVSAVTTAIRAAARQHRIEMRTLRVQEQAVQIPAEPGAEPTYVGATMVTASLETIRVLERALKARFVVVRVK